MARFAVAAAMLGVLLAHAPNAHAQEDVLTEEVLREAERAAVNPTDLAGALSSEREAGNDVTACSYLYFNALVSGCVGTALSVERPPEPAGNGWPIGGAMGQRIYCIEGIESTHGAHMYNPIPVGREHAQGWLGFLPSTAARYGAVIGNRASEWNAASRMIQSGAGRQFAGIAWGRC